jgi:hypothetical protein
VVAAADAVGEICVFLRNPFIFTMYYLLPCLHTRILPAEPVTFPRKLVFREPDMRVSLESKFTRHIFQVRYFIIVPDMKNVW